MLTSFLPTLAFKSNFPFINRFIVLSKVIKSY